MRKYYLFVIQKKYYNEYKEKPYVLYKILETLKEIKPYDFSYGLNIYQELCIPFSVKVLNNYLQNKIGYKKINKKIIKLNSNFEDTYIQINYSRVIIKTNVNRPQILKIFNIYNKKIFVCDFEEKDYFWLHTQIKKVILKY